MRRNYDAVVVGARVAGASTAFLLARAGLRVALIDRARYGSDTVSTHALMRAGVLQLHAWGLLDRVVAAGTPPISTAQFHYPDGSSVRVPIRPAAGVDALYAPRRYLLDRLLVDAAEEAGAHVMHQTTVTALAARYERPRARGLRSDPRPSRDSPSGVADGRRRRHPLHGRPAGRRTGHQAGPACIGGPVPVPRPARHADGYQWAYGQGAAAGLIPTNDGQSACSSARPPHR